MATMVRSCLQSLLKVVNAIIGMVGMAMILYALWMIRVWQKHMGSFSFSSLPWFIYTFLGLGVILCVITCSGHIAAETANGHCLSCYMVFIFLLLFIEAMVTADVFLNHNWEEDFPDDPSGKFDELKVFVKSNFGFCKWFGLLIVSVQGLSILVAMVIRALGPDQPQHYDSDDDYAPVRLPLLKHPSQPPSYVATNPQYAPKNDSWNARAHEKTNR